MQTPIYLDHHATTPCDDAVVQAMIPWFAEHFGNPGSRQHTWGLRAKAAVDLAREQVAELLGAQPREIVFTSGATESNNLAILGVTDAIGTPGHLITCSTEHSAVVDPMREAVRQGWRLTVLDPGSDGRLHPDQVRDAFEPDTRLVSLMLANNEIGVVQPVAEVAALCRERGVLIHTDAAQATGKLPVDVGALGVDLLSITGHKTYGPKGVGALWIRKRGRPRVAIRARQFGGGQEGDLRSGTLPVPMLVGLGACMAGAAKDLATGEPERLRGLRDALWDGLAAIDGVTLNGSAEHRLPHNLNVSVRGLRSGEMIAALRPSLACSSGSACSTEDPKPSRVLKAIGCTDEQSLGALRFGLGHRTTEADIHAAITAVTEVIHRLRAGPSARTPGDASNPRTQRP